jgi:glycolate oxidase iron-sulfur subunit
MVKDYGHLLRRDPVYAERAAKIAALARDPVEIVAAELPQITAQLASRQQPLKVAFHPPCTLQHGMRLRGTVEALLPQLGMQATPVSDKHLCCGSSGTYSILQPELANALKANRLAALQAGKPDVIASANIGCITHLASGTRIPVRHWIELLDERMSHATQAA